MYQITTAATQYGAALGREVIAIFGWNLKLVNSIIRSK
jgi:hypothetical protein